MRPLFVAALAVPSLAIFLPIYLSFLLGGWTDKYMAGSKPTWSGAMAMPSLVGRVAIVTGGGTGIGLETARALIRAGCTVIYTARTHEKARVAEAQIRRTLPANGDAMVGGRMMRGFQLDLGSLQSIQAFASWFKRLGLPLHMLILNAGVMMSPGAAMMGQELAYGYHATADGFEGHIGVNHIGHFYLTELLMGKLRKSAPSRVISVSSISNTMAPESGVVPTTWRAQRAVPEDYEDGAAYGQSKLSNVLFAQGLAEREAEIGSGVTAYSCHPGLVLSELERHLTAELDSQAKAKGAANVFLGAALKALLKLGLQPPCVRPVPAKERPRTHHVPPLPSRSVHEHRRRRADPALPGDHLRRSRQRRLLRANRPVPRRAGPSAGDERHAARRAVGGHRGRPRLGGGVVRQLLVDPIDGQPLEYPLALWVLIDGRWAAPLLTQAADPLIAASAGRIAAVILGRVWTGARARADTHE